MTPQLLMQIADDYALLHALSKGGAYLMRRTVALFSGFLDRPSTPADLDPATASRWLADLETRQALWTVHGHRTRLLCLWRYAHACGLAAAPGAVRREDAPDPQPVAWTVAEVAALVAHCHMVDGGELLRLWILAGYQSGLRKSDLMGLHRDQIGPVIQLRQAKTGYTHEPRLEPDLVAEILARPGDYPLRCPWGCRRYVRAWRTLCRISGVDAGGLQRLRRTGATAVACQEGEGAAREFLGHRSPEMVRYYLDRRIYHPRGHLPPRIAG